MAKPVAIIATQRSGTNLLRSTLASTPLFTDLNEVFESRQQGVFWEFRKQMILSNPDLSMPSEEHQTEIFNRFFDHLSETDAPFALVDIKYNSTHHFNPVFQIPTRRPFVLKLLADYGIPVIHLERANLAANVISELVANELKVWVSSQENAIDGKQVKIDIENLLYQIDRKRREAEMFRDWINGTSNLDFIRIRYEGLVDGEGQFRRHMLERIQHFLKIDQPLEVAITTKKIVKSVHDVVVNYESEVVPALIENGYEDFVQAA